MRKIYDIIPPSTEKKKEKDFMRSLWAKIICLILIIGLNWFGLSAVMGTAAYLSDIEDSLGNIFNATILDFSLTSAGDFSPQIIPTQNSTRNISVINDGILDFQYTISATNFSGILCNYLDLIANLDGGDPEYSGTLVGLNNFNAGQFASPEDWEFIAILTVDNSNLKNQTCTFDFVFYGTQIEGAGFYDQETISNTINSGYWVNPNLCFVINEVYYDPDAAHQGPPSEEKFEWIELYNACSQEINLQNWYFEDNNGREIINANYPVAAGQFVVVAANAAVWNNYWTMIPQNAVKIALGGNMMSNGLDNDGDRVVLYDNNNNQKDAVSWGTDTYAFDPSVPDVAEGHSIARITAGVDTDTAADWEDLVSPNPGINPHLRGRSENSGEEFVEEEPVIEEPIAEEPIIEESITEESIIEETLSEESTIEEPVVEEPIIEESVVEEPVIEDTPINEEENEENTEENTEQNNEEEIIIEQEPAIEPPPVTVPDSGEGDSGGSES